jgi:O-antigen/teichoic acid export membrane protein
MSRRVARNAIWNVAGTLSSVAVGLVALPVLLHALGAARLGIFTLALGLIGFSGLFDLGLGRALTQGVSQMLGQHRSREDVSSLVWHVLRLLALFGLFWSIIIWLIVPLIVERLFSLRGDLAAETVLGLRAVAVSIPFALVAIGAMGALEGLQRFRELSIWRSAFSVTQFGLPTIAALWHPDLGWVIVGLAGSRMISVGVWLRILNSVMPLQIGRPSQSGDMKNLLRFGGWLSVSNLIGPLMVNTDRFYLASILPPASVAAYTVSYDSLFRVTTIPFAAVGAMFPALAEAQSRPDSSAQMVRFAVAAVVTLALPPMLIGTIFAMPLLTLWLGHSFALTTLSVFKILVVGVFLSCTAHVPYALLQAHGRSDLTAKLHMFELPVFLCLLVLGASKWGVQGAAIASTLRVALDTGVTYVWSMQLNPSYRFSLAKGVGMVVLASAVLLVPLFTTDPLVLASLMSLTLLICIIYFMRYYSYWRKSNSETSPT